MRFNIVIILLLLSNITTLTSQDKINFGKLSEKEKAFKTFEKDSTVNAVVLYEIGDNYFEWVNNQIRIIKEYHVKIKILNKNGFDEGNISIPYYHNETTSEKITEIMAKTHNEISSHSVMPNQFFKNSNSEKWSELVFTFPQLQEGSILEYYYKLTSPFIYNFSGWTFQSSIPKLYSEFNASIPGIYHYNRELIGSLKLDTNEAHIKKKCTQIGRGISSGECEVLKYVMKDIPAFESEENYMLAASNYLSRIDFELSEMLLFNGSKKRYTKTWKDVDKEFKNNKNIGRQLSKKNFFEKNVPENLLTDGTELERAMNIYEFVRDHYTWNKKFGIFQKARVKEAFDDKVGNVAEINMSLINLLNAAGIETKLMLSSTRQQGLPKTSHPVISDFNYFLAKVEIDGKDYLLDATDKFIPFGMLPFRALNHYGRVMDFKNESYWFDIVPWRNNRYQIRGELNFDIENNKADGILDILNLGYNAVDLRQEFASASEEAYLEKIEDAFNGDYKITYYEPSKKSNEKRFLERFKFESESAINGNMVYLNPFIIHFFNKNPFTTENRDYPIDFGYPRNYKYQMNFHIPDGYAVHELPENRVINLGEESALLKFYHQEAENQLLFLFDLKLNSTHFTPENYDALKQLFAEVTEIQQNSLVILKKI
ncbi:transglutaminase domain-containing protein [Maribacter arenosus]|uniref:DUF3857 domain-containing protein n=1 Tax=Maribacter arenosus TaxID=1854708 RepID=A0ABR7VB07_9FLAO|nr:DUF3857 domain-containing protein [Maribacter arenosus]MBD0850807.1 DUF3857 domain-containing protein [Maribacter arenosus]